MQKKEPKKGWEIYANYIYMWLPKPQFSSTCTDVWYIYKASIGTERAVVSKATSRDEIVIKLVVI